MCFLPFSSSRSPAEVASLTVGVFPKRVVLTLTFHLVICTWKVAVGHPRDALQRLPQAVGQSPFLDGRPGAEGQAHLRPSGQGPSAGRAPPLRAVLTCSQCAFGPVCRGVPEPAAHSAQQAFLGHRGPRGGVSKATFASGLELIVIRRAAEVPSMG